MQLLSIGLPVATLQLTSLALPVAEIIYLMSLKIRLFKEAVNFSNEWCGHEIKLILHVCDFLR